MPHRTRQGLGIALIGAAAWALAAVTTLMADGGLSVYVALVVGLVAIAGVVALVGGVIMAGVGLLRGPSNPPSGDLSR